MKKYFYIRNFYKIVFGIIGAYLFSGIGVMISYIYEIEAEGYDVRIAFRKSMFIIAIMTSFLFIAVFKVISLRYKKIRNQSILKHSVPLITREQVLEQLEEQGFEIYSIGNIQIGLCMGNRKKFRKKSCYVFLLLGENMMFSRSLSKNRYAFSIYYENIKDEKAAEENEELDKINEELDRVINNYLRGQAVNISPIVCFWGECFSNKAMEKCCKGVDFSLSEICIGYETFNEKLYYAEAVEKLGLADYNIKAKWIRKIFKI